MLYPEPLPSNLVVFLTYNNFPQLWCPEGEYSPFGQVGCHEASCGQSPAKLVSSLSRDGAAELNMCHVSHVPPRMCCQAEWQCLAPSWGYVLCQPSATMALARQTPMTSCCTGVLAAAAHHAPQSGVISAWKVPRALCPPLLGTRVTALYALHDICHAHHHLRGRRLPWGVITPVLQVRYQARPDLAQILCD